MKYEPVIGLEIHVELATASKMFCGCKNDPFYAEKPNIYTCPTCLGLPGALPIPNRKAIEWTVKLGLALGCSIPSLSKFDRKNYFYPDLPKGYQISQYDQPLCKNGLVEINEGDVRINRVHLEEDTGKSLHSEIDGEKVTLIDFNRSGVPLVEIVTEPDIHNGDHAKAFLKKLHQIIRYLEISGADMEKGSMRLEPNISLKKEFQKKLPTYKVEIKNINSFLFVKKAIDYEIQRQENLLKKGEEPQQETRGYVEATQSTVSQRVKESSSDYRYFPEPDIPPFEISQQRIREWKGELPELPDRKSERFKKDYALDDNDIAFLIDSKDRADYFENCVSLIEANDTYKDITPQIVAKKIVNRKQDKSTISPQNLLDEIEKKKQDGNVDLLLLTQAVKKALSEQEQAVYDVKNGKTEAIMFLVGQVKRTLHGKGDAETIKKELERQLGKK